MFRFDRKKLPCCAICNHNQNKKKYAVLPGAKVKCMDQESGTMIAESEVCPSFDLNINMLEYIVYNKVAINLDGRRTCVVDDQGNIKVAEAPLHILVAILKQHLDGVGFRQRNRRCLGKLNGIVSVVETILANKLGSMSAYEQQLAATYLMVKWRDSINQDRMGKGVGLSDEEIATIALYYGVSVQDLQSLNGTLAYVKELLTKRHLL